MSRKIVGVSLVVVILIGVPAILFAEDVSLDTLTVWVQEIVHHQEGQDARLDDIEERLEKVEEKISAEPAAPVASPITATTDTPPQNQESASDVGIDGGAVESCQLALRNRVDFKSLETYLESWPDNILPIQFEIVTVSQISEIETGILMRVKSYMGDAIYQDESWYHSKDRFLLEVWSGCELLVVHTAERAKNESPVVEAACRLAAQDRIQLASIGSYMEQWPHSALTGNAEIVSVWHVPAEGTVIMYEPFWNRDGGNSGWGGRYLTERWDGCEFVGSAWGEDDAGWTRGGFLPKSGHE